MKVQYDRYVYWFVSEPSPRIRPACARPRDRRRRYRSQRELDLMETDEGFFFSHVKVGKAMWALLDPRAIPGDKDLSVNSYYFIISNAGCFYSIFNI